MGAICGCYNFKDSESFIKLVFTTTCLDNLTYQQLELIIASKTKGGKDTIILETFKLIMNEIYQEKYQKWNVIDYNSNSNEKEYQGKPIIPNNRYRSELKKVFDDDFFNLINQNNITNNYIVRLILCPFVLKESDPNLKSKSDYFFRCLQNINFEESSDILSHDKIDFKHFNSTMLFYLCCVLILYSTKMLTIMKETGASREIIEDLDYHCKDFFQKEVINSYFSKIINDYLSNLNYADIDINTYLISSDDFYKIVQSSPQLLDYWSLRSHFLNYAYSYKNAIETE